jgi:antitoxin (DNA-binding transcriptional repressor) of toxin-antitoxin stability system
VDRAAAGKEMVIVKHGQPMAKLVPMPLPPELLKPFGNDP